MQTNRLLICGGRDFTDDFRFDLAMMAWEDWKGKPSSVIAGGAKGADTMAANYFKPDPEVGVEVFPAYWEKEGRKAGPLRNIRMLEEGKPDAVLAMPGGKGTDHMTSIAVKAGVPTYCTTFDEETGEVVFTRCTE